MPRNTSTALPQPIFDEGNITRDPTRFKTAHPSDTAQYKEIQNLLKKDVVGFEPSRISPGDIYTLESAFGAHGPEIMQRIKAAGKIVIHAAGDTGASNEGKYGNEIRVADQLTKDSRTSNLANRALVFLSVGRRCLRLWRVEILLRSILRSVSKLPRADLRHSGQPRLLRDTEHARG